MDLFRLLTILTLLPITAMSGIPHVGCRCSTGEIRWSCPKLRAQQSHSAAEAKTCCRSQKTAARKSCCDASQDTECCCPSSSKSPKGQESCCADGCRCTPVLIASDVGPKVAKASVPDLQIDVAHITDLTGILVHVVRPDVFQVESKPDVPIDLIVLFERFLI